MGQPRYVVIAGDLMQKIAAERWPVGELLPTEPELAAEYGVSRETLRRSLRRLEVAGLISRHPGTGTRVERSTPVAAFTTHLGSVEDLTQYGEAAVRSVLSVEPITVDAELSAVTGLAEGARQVCVTSTRRDPGSPDEVVSWARVYLEPGDAKAVAGDLAEESGRLIADSIEARTGRAVDRVVQQVRAVGVPAEAAAHLGVESGSPGLEFVRRYYDASGALFEVTVSTHAGDRFVYETVLQRR
ncbi:GntR family transcriptional regulator [Streptomyces himastatinicus ATCC 53653]|uniref:GntR family transcriptional regulator n=1 Tax=Streptomyces himastatinicus ATCC 53653 TaxID=457427 RepID=D9WSG3_9ACTN|nr:GntR family transcriptional regulator [Streptomyces himastatinicus]EFL22104.1 GntR family transcriptional regulator [Streptomyces himastatinicus ATCC 53653]